MVRKTRKIVISSENELKRFCGVFGFEGKLTRVVRKNLDGKRLQPVWELTVKTKEGKEVVGSKWEKYDYSMPLRFYGKCAADCLSSLSKCLSEKRWITYRSVKTVSVPFGAKKVTEETKIDLPDFASVSELVIKAEAQA